MLVTCDCCARPRASYAGHPQSVVAVSCDARVSVAYKARSLIREMLSLTMNLYSLVNCLLSRSCVVFFVY